MEKRKMNFGQKLMASLVRLLGRLPLGFHRACAAAVLDMCCGRRIREFETILT